MDVAIIHISDLHVTNHINTDGDLISFDILKSHFTTDSKNILSESYLDKIIKSVKVNCDDHKLYLIVTGDITDSAHETEFQVATRLLNKLCSELEISKERVLITPGDHDVNWGDCKNAFDKLGGDSEIRAYDLMEAKFKKFKNFYDNFFDSKTKTFNPETAICDSLIIEDYFQIVGLNSNFRIGTMSAPGFIPKPLLQNELDKVKNNLPKTFAFHHNFNAAYEKNNIGDWDQYNFNDIRSILQTAEATIVFYGNEHTPESLERKEFGISSCGAIGSKSSKKNSFKIYKVKSNNGGLKIDIDLISKQDHGNSESLSVGYFSKESNPEHEKKSLIIKEPKSLNSPIVSSEIPSSLNNQDIPQVDTNFSKKLLKIVRDKKLFHSGHFHWSKTSRAHNWIDITKILNKYEDLSIAKDAIIDLINKNISADFDLVIGLGLEGIILSTKVAVKYNKPYSHYPYSYRWDDHNASEKELNFINDGQFKSVLIITDVVNDGRTIRKLIHKRANDFFSKVSTIYVASLFYTGDKSSKTPKILNVDNPEIGDHKENRIEYYFVLDLKVEKCPYKENYETECEIIRNKLGCVHYFYNNE